MISSCLNLPQTYNPYIKSKGTEICSPKELFYTCECFNCKLFLLHIYYVLSFASSSCLSNCSVPWSNYVELLIVNHGIFSAIAFPEPWTFPFLLIFSLVPANVSSLAWSHTNKALAANIASSRGPDQFKAGMLSKQWKLDKYTSIHIWDHLSNFKTLYLMAVCEYITTFFANEHDIMIHHPETGTTGSPHWSIFYNHYCNNCWWWINENPQENQHQWDSQLSLFWGGYTHWYTHWSSGIPIDQPLITLILGRLKGDGKHWKNRLMALQLQRPHEVQRDILPRGGLAGIVSWDTSVARWFNMKHPMKMVYKPIKISIYGNPHISW